MFYGKFGVLGAEKLSGFVWPLFSARRRANSAVVDKQRGVLCVTKRDLSPFLGDCVRTVFPKSLTWYHKHNHDRVRGDVECHVTMKNQSKNEFLLNSLWYCNWQSRKMNSNRFSSDVEGRIIVKTTQMRLKD